MLLSDFGIVPSRARLGAQSRKSEILAERFKLEFFQLAGRCQKPKRIVMLTARNLYKARARSQPQIKTTALIQISALLFIHLLHDF